MESFECLYLTPNDVLLFHWESMKIQASELLGNIIFISSGVLKEKLCHPKHKMEVAEKQKKSIKFWNKKFKILFFQRIYFSQYRKLWFTPFGLVVWKL